MRQDRVKHERGVALLAFVALVGIVATWFLVKQLNMESSGLDAARKQRNAEVLSRAKLALIGYVAQRAARSGENDPGALPCPEASGYYGVAADEGIAAGNCSLPAVGRLPWRTLGLDKLVDATGEPLWYVVANGWAKPNSSTNTVINSNCTSSTSGLTCWSEQLTVDGVANDAVALIIAPGPAMNPPLPPPTGCTAVNQVRPVAGPPNLANWLECENATNPANATFVTTGPNGSFNDQVIKITASELMPAIEAAVAYRIERDIVPTLRDVYLGTAWGLTGKERLFPFAAAFGDPSLAATSFQGAAAATQGLLPFTYGEACAPATEPRCLLMAFSPATPPVAYQAGGFGTIRETSPGVTSQTCGWDPTDTSAVVCDGEYLEDNTSAATLAGAGMYIEMTATITNVAKGLRVLYAWIGARDDVALGAWQVMTPNIVTTMNADGSATIRFGANLPNIDAQPPSPPGWGTYAQYRIRLKIADHPILSTRPREIDFNTGNSTEIRVGQTVVGATSGASGRVSKVTVQSGNWEVALTPAVGKLTLYSVTGAFVSGEDLRVLGVTRARSASADSDADIDLSWFARNEWYRNVYYAVAGNYAWTGSGTCSDVPAVTCLQVANLPIAADQTKQRALLTLMGKRVAGQTRPSALLLDYLDSAENRNLDSNFEQLKVGSSSNDRFISISKNP